MNEELKHNVKQTFKKDEQDPADVLKGMTPGADRGIKSCNCKHGSKSYEEKAEETKEEAAEEYRRYRDSKKKLLIFIDWNQVLSLCMT